MSRNPFVVARIGLAIAAVIALYVLFPKVDSSSYAGALIFAAVFVLVADLISFTRGMVQNGLMVVAALVLGVSGLEFYERFMQPHVGSSNPRLWRQDPVLGSGPNAGVFPFKKTVDDKNIYDVTYSIDADHLRATKSAAAGATVAFLGDSFTFGEGVNDADTLPQSFADLMPGTHVLNLGYSGYSPAQALRELEVGQFAKELASTRLFVLLTGPWHAERTACKPFWGALAPRYGTDDGKLVFKGPCASGFGLKAALFFKQLAVYHAFLENYLGRPSHADIETYLVIVEAIAKIARDQYGAPLEILYSDAAHYLDGTGWTDDEVETRMRAAGARVITTEVKGKPGEVLAIAGDGHPTGTANRLLARKLVDDLRATMPNVLDITARNPGEP